MNNNFGISLLSMIPMRETPSEKSQLVNQLLFGEYYIVTEDEPNWIQVRSQLDGYSGWIDKKMHFPFAKEEFEQWHQAEKHVVQSIFEVDLINETDDYTVKLSPGCLIPKTFHNNRFHIGSKTFNLMKTNINTDKIELETLAKGMLGVPYLWGGKTPYGIDCSGFIQVLFRKIWLDFPRDASQQVLKGVRVNSIKSAHKGDLAFFGKKSNKITHVGIILENNYIIHASGRVRIDQLDDKGIFNKEINEYSHQLQAIRRI